MDEAINNKKIEFNKITKEVQDLINTRNSISQDIQKNVNYMKKLQEGFNKARQRVKKRQQFGLNFR